MFLLLCCAAAVVGVSYGETEVFTHQEAHQLKVLAQELFDRHRIGDLLTKYATAVDSVDMDMYMECFTKDAVIDYTAAGGSKGSPAEMAAFLDRVFSPKNFVYFSRQQHLITNVDISRTGKDTAKVRAAFHAPMSLSLFPLEYGPLSTVAGWYHHTLVRESDGQWRSSSLREEIAYNQTTVHLVVLIVAVVWGLRTLSAIVFSSGGSGDGEGTKKKGE